MNSRVNNSEKAKMIPCVAVHGGAWNIPEELKEDSGLGCKDAATVAYRILEHGGSCVDAVTAAVSCLEDNPCFDAGRGSVLNEKREIEMHAMVMRGDTCDVGGCLSLTSVKNPVQAARVTLEQSRHCLLTEEAALKLARKHGIEEKEFEYFLTDYAKKEFEKMANYATSLTDLFNSTTRGHDTVGAVAIDKDGNLACATSTGGITRQIAGRVSDSCLVGSGGFADNEIGAISTTGHGESIMKVNLARLIGFKLEQGFSPAKATKEALEHMKRRVGGCGGAITVDPRGRVDVYHNTDNMSWAIVRGESKTANGDVMIQYGIDLNNVNQDQISSELIQTPMHALRVRARPMMQLNVKRNRSPGISMREEESSPTPSSPTSSGADTDEEIRSNMGVARKRSRRSLV